MRRYQQAFTLIELLVTMAVLAIVLGIAIPSFNQQIINANSVALAEDLAGAFNFARIEAVKRATRVSICASSDGATCTGAWRDGFIAYVDTAPSDTSATTTVEVGGDAVLKYWTDFDPRVTLTATRNNTAITFIRYTGLGALARNAAGEITVTAKLTGCTGDKARKITIGLSGLTTVKPDPCT